MQITGAELLIKCLKAQGVDTIFGFPGGFAINIYDALHQDGTIRHILTSHEQGAAHGADGYARATGKVGVVMSTSGPGATNLVTGIATANMDSVPIVAITGNVPLSMLGRDSFQEVDITGVTMPITKHNYIVPNVEDLPRIVAEAFSIASSGRKGPVLIDIPKDVQIAPYEYSEDKLIKMKTSLPKKPSKESLAKMAAFINKAKRPLIYYGGGIISANASKELAAFAEKLDSPTTCSLMGLGGMSSKHKLFVGTIGMHGDLRSAQALKTCDTLIAIGARFSDRVAGDRKKFAENIKVAHIDIDKAEINKNVRVDASLVADAKVALKALLPLIKQKNNKEWLAEITKNSAKHTVAKSKADPNPKHIIELIRELSPNNQIVATDVGQHQMWTSQFFKFYRPRTFISSLGLGTMGYGLGAANGVAVGTGRKTILITGDGSFHMNMNELATACKYNLPVVIFVLNNRTLGMVRQWQTLFFNKRYSQTNIEQKTDFVKLAEVFGAKGFRITSNAEAPAIIKKALAQSVPVVVDCQIDTDEFVLPMIPAGKTVDDIITNPELN